MIKTLLIVDDEELNREMLNDILCDDYNILMADNGERAIELLKTASKEIYGVLLDLIMPGVDGFAVLARMKDMGLSDKIPVLVISGEDSVQAERRCLEQGASDFIRKPFNDTIVRNRTKNAIELFAYKNNLEDRVKKQTETLRKQYQLVKTQANQLRKKNTQIIEVLGSIVECRNLESGEHVKRVRDYTRALARVLMDKYPEYGLDEELIEKIGEASVLHDVGKITIPDKILLKNGKLTDEEYDYMKSHTTRGYEMLAEIGYIWDDDYATLSMEICRHHHERYDGKGYPDGLKGDEIPISAQLVSIADVYDALVNERCYKSAYTPEKAFHMIVGGECGIFSPKVIECFRIGRGEFESIARGKEDMSGRIND